MSTTSDKLAEALRELVHLKGINNKFNANCADQEARNQMLNYSGRSDTAWENAESALTIYDQEKNQTGGGTGFTPQEDEKEIMRILHAGLLGLVYDEKPKKREGFFYFIEHDRTHQWLTRKGEWTIDPNACMKFEYEAFALIYAYHALGCCYLITEHEFPESQPPAPSGDSLPKP